MPRRLPGPGSVAETGRPHPVDNRARGVGCLRRCAVFWGRERELGRLDDELDASGQSGQGRMLALRGRPTGLRSSRVGVPATCSATGKPSTNVEGRVVAGVRDVAGTRDEGGCAADGGGCGVVLGGEGESGPLGPRRSARSCRCTPRVSGRAGRGGSRRHRRGGGRPLGRCTAPPCRAAGPRSDRPASGDAGRPRRRSCW